VGELVAENAGKRAAVVSDVDVVGVGELSGIRALFVGAVDADDAIALGDRQRARRRART
jgi:hypothetical protein